MLSSGGIATVETATRFPVRLLESGPAAGAIAAARCGSRRGTQELISFDMGGTTAKIAVIDDGEPTLAQQFEVDRVYRFKKGSGLPVRQPVIELIEIGTGGGSIARIDALGLMKVGPDSAGADPGPACYGRGGVEPTVTDANLLLGFLNADYFLGGEMSLDRDAAATAIRTKIAEPSGLSLEEAAWGIHQVANESMANAARVHVLERGYDPRRFPLLAFGGAGPVHAYRIAASLGSPTLIVPFAAGVMSTIGFLSAPLAFDGVRSWNLPIESIDESEAEQTFQDLERSGEQLLVDSGIPSEKISHRRFVDLRYVGQGHSVRVAWPGTAGIQAAFEERYRALYERQGPPVAIEALHWRVVSSGPSPDLKLQPTLRGEGEPQKGSRDVYLPESKRLEQVPVFDRYRLPQGYSFDGPAIVEERESTLVLGPDAKVVVDEQLNLVVDLPEQAR